MSDVSDPPMAFVLSMSRAWLEKFWFDPEETEEFDDRNTADMALDSFQDHLIEHLGRSGWEDPGVTVTWKLDDGPAARFPIWEPAQGTVLTGTQRGHCEVAFRKFKEESREFLKVNQEVRESEST